MGEQLRDALTAAFEQHTVENSTIDNVDASADIPVPQESKVSASEAAPSKIAEPKPAKAKEDDTGRLHAPDGKYVAKETKVAGTAAKASTPQLPPPPPQEALAPPVVPASKRPPRPSSWKKEYWDHWDKLDPALAEYLNVREGQFASGVSTYKAEAEAAKPLMQALEPFMPLLQQHKIDPAQWIGNLGNAHQRLVFGSPQEKLNLFAKLANDYGIPLTALYDQQAQQQYLATPHTPQPQRNVLTREEADKLFQQKFQEHNSTQEIVRFQADGKHPHFDEVRDTMAGLLTANLAEDLESAYQAALRHPKHAELWTALQEQDRAAKEAERKAQEAQRLATAKGKAVSPRSATPTAPSDSEKPKGLRSSLESAFEQHAGGRV